MGNPSLRLSEVLCLFGLRSIAIMVMSRRSVWASLDKVVKQYSEHILSLEADNSPSSICGRRRMTVVVFDDQSPVLMGNRKMIVVIKCADM